MSDLLLLVDDDTAIVSALAPILGREGFEVVTAGDGAAALALISERTFAVVVLDVMMPVLDGRETLRRLRAQDASLPVILLTSVGEAGERARALDEGADDYLNKPFDVSELVSRVRAVLRRTSRGTPSLATQKGLVSGPLRLDRHSRRLWVGQQEVDVTPKALALLDYLITHPDEVITRERLLQVVWGYAHPVGTRAVDNRVGELRKALGDDAAAPTWIATVAGSGYRFTADVQVSR